MLQLIGWLNDPWLWFVVIPGIFMALWLGGMFIYLVWDEHITPPEEMKRRRQKENMRKMDQRMSDR